MIFPRCVGRAAAIVAVLTLTPSIAESQRAADVLELRIGSEAAPPGAITQVKIEVTEAKPIIFGDSHIGWSLGEIDGVALGSSDSAAIAVVRDGVVKLSILSPTGSFGMSSDYVVTLTGRVPIDAPFGARLPVTLDADSLRMFDPDGVMYAAEIDDGEVTVANRITIADVVPGSANLAAGSIVSIFGGGFTRNTRVDFGDALLAQVRYVSPTQINVVLAEPARMHGMRVRARNEDGFRVTYFSYQRTRRAAPSAHPVLCYAVPVFPVRAMHAATVRLDRTTVGLALQNIEKTDAQVFAKLTNGDGVAVAAAVVPVGANRFVVRTIGEIFGRRFSAPGTVHLSSADAVQVLGVDIDASGAARPRLPE